MNPVITFWIGVFLAIAGIAHFLLTEDRGRIGLETPLIGGGVILAAFSWGAI